MVISQVIKMKEIFERLWKLALPYQDKRDDIGHAETVLSFAERLIKLEKADEDIVIPAAILHDIGWSRIPKAESLKIFDSKISGDERIRIQKKHEESGTDIAKQILEKANYNKKLTNEILEIISRHDTGKGFLSKNEGIVRDADKLYRFSKIGFLADIKRRGNAPKEEYDRLKDKIYSPDFFYSESAKKIAGEELEKSMREFGETKGRGNMGDIMISSKKGAQAQLPPAVRKAQVSIEFLAMLILAMFFALLIYASNVDKVIEIQTAGRQQEIEAGCDSMASAINDAYYFGNGFSRNMTIGGNYTISISNGTIICYDSNRLYIGSIVPQDVRNSTGHSAFEMKAALQKLRIENRGYILIT